MNRSSVYWVWSSALHILCLVCCLIDSAPAADLVSELQPVLEIVSGRSEHWQLQAQIEVPIDGRQQTISAAVSRSGGHEFDLSLAHADYAIRISRRAEKTLIQMPLHSTAYVGSGEIALSSSLAPEGLLQRLVSADSQAFPFVSLFAASGTAGSETLLQSMLQSSGLATQTTDNSWKIGNLQLTVDAPGHYVVVADQTTVRLQVLSAPQVRSLPLLPDVSDATELTREELEDTLVSGVRRATEILLPGPSLLNPQQTSAEVDHGRLIWRGNQRIVTLWGTPEQIGTAHGQLLKAEARRCIDSVMNTFAVASLIRTGRWFRHDLEEAWGRLQPHIPERHLAETRAMAVAIGCDPHRLEVLNVFPELFHCSGFAVMKSATSDGRLYHGRVLDYMTTIGLQDAATTFLIRPSGYQGFATVGYAGFTGSVSGMNVSSISLGEMGGRGEGNWDGVPMATLMRRALEECNSLAEVIQLWKESPRTCEYYYVFADGKTREAAGVAATPESIEFIGPGEGHELLGPGIPDAVVLSAGSRLEELRRRVQQEHGQIDEQKAMWLMSRPVAMKSNLHNVLFVPESGVLWVANASHDRPAAEMPYERIALQDFPELFAEPQDAGEQRAVTGSGSRGEQP